MKTPDNPLGQNEDYQVGDEVKRCKHDENCFRIHTFALQGDVPGLLVPGASHVCEDYRSTVHCDIEPHDNMTCPKEGISCTAWHENSAPFQKDGDLETEDCATVQVGREMEPL